MLQVNNNHYAEEVYQVYHGHHTRIILLNLMIVTLPNSYSTNTTKPRCTPFLITICSNFSEITKRTPNDCVA